MGTYVLFLFKIGVLVSCADGLTKNWNYDWNLENPDNWLGKEFSCQSKIGVLPATLDNAVFIGSSLSFLSFEMPLSGEIIFGDDAQLLFGSPLTRENKKGCSSTPQEVKWNHFGQDKWWDALAWEIPVELHSNSSSVPDTHRVPCTTDVARLPDPESYRAPVHFTPPVISVTAITIGRKNYSTTDLLDFARYNSSDLLTGASSADGRLFLYAEEDEECSSGYRDCKCVPHQNIQQVICRSRKSPCPDAFCDNPVDMVGFCCKQCGVEISLTEKFVGSKSRLEGIVSSVSLSNPFKGIASYVGLMEDDRFHIFLTPKENYGDYTSAGTTLVSALTKELGVAVDDLLTVNAAGTSVWQKSQTSASAVAALVALFLIVIVAALVFFIHKRGMPFLSPSARNRFRRLSLTALRRFSRVSLQNDILTSRRESEASSGATSGPSFNARTGLRFTNPVFSKSTASLAAMPIEPDGDSSTERATQENPMYRAYVHMTPEEKQAAEDSNNPPAGPPKPPRVTPFGFQDTVNSPGVVKFSDLGTIEEDELMRAETSATEPNEEKERAGTESNTAVTVIEIGGEEEEEIKFNEEEEETSGGRQDENLDMTPNLIDGF